MHPVLPVPSRHTAGAQGDGMLPTPNRVEVTAPTPSGFLVLPVSICSIRLHDHGIHPMLAAGVAERSKSELSRSSDSIRMHGKGG